MDDLNPADFTVLQSDLDPVRMKRGIREQILNDASGQSPGALVLFEDNGNVGSPRHVAAAVSIHENHLLAASSETLFGPPPGTQERDSGVGIG